MAKKEFGISLKVISKGLLDGLKKAESYLKSFQSNVKKRLNFGDNPSLSKLGSSFRGQLKVIESSVKTTESKLKDFGKTIAGIFAIDQFMNLGRTIINVGSTFQTQMARVRAVSNATEEEFKALQKRAEDLGATTKYSATEAAEALENLLRNGMNTSEAIEALDGVLKLASSQAIDLAKAADISTIALNGFGLKAKDLNKVIDILAAGASSSATDVEGLSDALVDSAPLAAKLGLSFEELVAALGTLSNAGIQGGRAGTTLRAMMNRLVAPTSKATEALKKYGLTMNEAEIKANGFTKTLEKLSKAGLSIADAKIIFGEEYGSNVLGLLGQQKSYETTKVTLENSQGTADRQTEIGQGSFEKALTELGNSWETALNKIFKATEPILTKIINVLKGFVDKLSSIPTLITIAVSALSIAIGRARRKIDDQINKEINQESVAFNNDIFAAITTKEGSGDIVDMTSMAMEGRLKDTIAYVKKLEELYEGLSETDKKSAEKSIKLAKEYIEALQRRISYEKQLADLEEVKEPTPPKPPQHYSQSYIPDNALTNFADTVGGVAGGVAGVAGEARKNYGTVSDVGKKLEITDEALGEFNDDLKKTEAFARGVEGAAKATSGITKGFKKFQAWLKNAELPWRKKKEATGYYTGEKSKKRELEAYEEQKRIYENDLRLYREYEAKKERIESAKKADERKSRRIMEDAQSVSGRSFEELQNLDPIKELDSLESSYQALEKKRKDLKKNWTGLANQIGRAFKSVGSFVFNALGGWIGIATTAISIAINSIYNYFQEQKRVFKEVKSEMEGVLSKYSAMESQAMSLINVLKSNSRETLAWKSALEALKNEFPKLAEKLDLERIYLEDNGRAYSKLEDKIKAVIKAQKQYLLLEQSRSAITKLQEDFQTKTKGIDKDLTNLFKKGSFDDNSKITKEAAQILSAQVKSNITGMLSGGTGKDAIADYLRSELKKYNVLDNTAVDFEKSISRITDKLVKEYSKYGKAIDSINNLVEKEGALGQKDIESLVDVALDRAKYRASEIEKTEKAKGTGEDEIKTMIQSSNSTILDELVTSLNEITTKIGEQSALDFAQGLSQYKELLTSAQKQETKKGGKGGTTTITTETEVTYDDIPKKTPKQLFDETKKYIDALKNSGIIDEKEYRDRLLAAYETYISGLESEKKTDAKSLELIKSLNKERDKLKEQIEAATKAEENLKKINEELAEKRKEELEKDKERSKQASEISDSRENAFDRNKQYEPYKWDKFFNANNQFEGDLVSEEQKLEKLNDYIEGLKSIAGDKFDIDLKLKDLEGLEGKGVAALREELEKLSSVLGELEKEATNLDDKIQLKRAKKEIEDLNKDIWKQGYEGVKSYFSSITSLGDAFKNIKESWGDMSDTERVFTTIDTFFSTVDTIWGMVEAWQSLSDLFEILSFKKQALESIEKATSASTIAAVQGEAAAVVAAEGEKTAAITGALAAQTSANLVAKTAQTKAAMVAMAAESTAAYAGIPIAGVALAAAQIAEMEALVAAVAALPMFAEGGIVGGSKYYGDQNLARVNSGEMILNRSQQYKLWNMVNGGSLKDSSMKGEVEFKISGQVLKGVLKNHDKKMSKLS